MPTQLEHNFKGGALERIVCSTIIIDALLELGDAEEDTKEMWFIIHAE